MKAKSFYAETSREALRQVKDALGPDAVILANRKVDGGIEIVAMAGRISRAGQFRRGGKGTTQCAGLPFARGPGAACAAATTGGTGRNQNIAAEIRCCAAS